MKLDEIARRIHAHLKRFERDPKINALHPKYQTTPYYYAMAWRGGSRIGVRYVAYQNKTFLTKEEALNYLAWLDAGNEGTFWKFEREAPKEAANDR